ncbi:c-type cytochrome [Aquincola sp. S2]|uniref:C-type cytochrome n=1 Tax=Pseudaquabacterium terrae TaxID=2732868 RepID=A0ABX2EI01_9BURK|nr:c-type cytochrome [Aquabacterium terrae]NRF68230.1 c-type cytochrome [Aquabacterium terrae]
MTIESVLRPAGPAAAAGAETGWVLIVGSALVLMLVGALLAWALLRRRAAGEQHDERRLVRRWVIGGGLAFPALTMLALFAYATARERAWNPLRTADEPVITVTAHLWWWQVQHRDPARGIDVTLANELHIPAGRPVTIGLASADVIHALWLPSLAGKVDAIPGRVLQLRLQADRPGRWQGRCAEFCGEQHARMGLVLVAHAPDDYARWLAAQARPAAVADETLAQQGWRLFMQQRCNSCHALRGLTESPSITAPDLTHVGSRLTIGAGARPLDRAALAAWIADPQQWKPGVRMPSYGDRLSAGELDALAAFLERLQ